MPKRKEMQKQGYLGRRICDTKVWCAAGIMAEGHGENATFWDAEQEAGRLFAGSEYDANTSAMFD